MRRGVARGRLVPQSRSTDPRFGRVSLKAAILYDRMWINADDQGRLSGDPDEIKYTACPNLPDISKEDIPGLLKELEGQHLIKVYSTSTTTAAQMLGWWEEQKLQWAYPSPYSPPDGWTDHLRYHLTPTEIKTENWPPTGLASALPDKLPNNPANSLPSETASTPGNSLGQRKKVTKKEIEKGKRRGRGRGKLPSGLGSITSPSAADFCTDRNKISNELVENFTIGWGRVDAKEPNKVIPRVLGGRELAQLRDLTDDLIAGGGCPLGYIREAFKEAAGQNKAKIWYVRAILLDWLGIER